MKIYLAGFSTIEKKFIEPTKDIYLLSSFWEHKGGKYGDYVTQEKHLLDSGAFTFINSMKNKNIDWHSYVDRYIEFINLNDIKYFFELDVDSIVGLDKVKKFTKYIESKTNKQCIPVWHKSRGLDYWNGLVKDYKYVSIGGIVSREITRKDFIYLPALINIAKEQNTRVHGLGFTSPELLKKIKFDSVDSTSWLAGRFARIYAFKNERLNSFRPKNKRVKDWYPLHLHNFKQWIEYQKYANNNL